MIGVRMSDQNAVKLIYSEIFDIANNRLSRSDLTAVNKDSRIAHMNKRAVSLSDINKINVHHIAFALLRITKSRVLKKRFRLFY